jgi:hypothetical protein
MKRSLRNIFHTPVTPVTPESPKELTPIEFFLSHSPSERLRLAILFDEIVQNGERGVLHDLVIATAASA